MVHDKQLRHLLGRVQWVLLYKHGATKLRNWQNFLQDLNTNEIIAISEVLFNKNIGPNILLIQFFLNEIEIWLVEKIGPRCHWTVCSLHLPNIILSCNKYVYITRFERFAEIGFNWILSCCSPLLYSISYICYLLSPLV